MKLHFFFNSHFSAGYLISDLAMVENGKQFISSSEPKRKRSFYGYRTMGFGGALISKYSTTCADEGGWRSAEPIGKKFRMAELKKLTCSGMNAANEVSESGR